MIGHPLEEAHHAINRGIDQLRECKKQLQLIHEKRLDQLAQALTTPPEQNRLDSPSKESMAPYTEAYEGLEYLRNGQHAQSISLLTDSWNRCIEHQDSLGVLSIGSFLIGVQRWFDATNSLVELTSIMKTAAEEEKLAES